VAIFFAFPVHFVCKLLKINMLVVEAAESNPTSVLKTLNLLILGMPALQEMQ